MLRAQAKIFLCSLFMLMVLNPCYAQSSLIEDLKQDSSFQDAVIIAIRTALGARQQTNVVRRVNFSAEIRIYIESYRELRNSNTLTNIQKRYNTVRAQLLEPRLPATIEELILMLEKL